MLKDKSGAQPNNLEISATRLSAIDVLPDVGHPRHQDLPGAARLTVNGPSPVTPHSSSPPEWWLSPPVARAAANAYASVSNWSIARFDGRNSGRGVGSAKRLEVDPA
jgi:hypothetical protein